MKKALLALVLVVFVTCPFFIHAEDSNSGAQTKIVQLENPLGNGVNSISGLVYKVINFIATFLLAIAAFFIIYSGFKFVMASGNPEKLQEAKDSLKNALIGTALILIAGTVGKVIEDIITKLQAK